MAQFIAGNKETKQAENSQKLLDTNTPIEKYNGPAIDEKASQRLDSQPLHQAAVHLSGSQRQGCRTAATVGKP